MVEAQKWLTDNYESKKNEITELRIEKDTELQGALKIENYPKLKEIFLGGAGKISELEIVNCPAVETLQVSNNEITKIEGLEGLTMLSEFSFGGNKVEKIDVSKNTKLGMLNFRNNPTNLEFTNGIKNLTELMSLYSYKTFVLTKFLDQASKEELKDIAGALGLNAGEKSLADIKKDIIDKIQKDKEDKAKLGKELPGLLKDSGEVDDNKLGEIKGKVEKGDEYQKLVGDTNNIPILNSDKSQIDQSKLNDTLNKSKDYENLVKDNPSLVTDGKIDPNKIKGLSGSNDELVKAVENFFGPEYKKILKLRENPQLQANIEVNTNKQ